MAPTEHPGRPPAVLVGGIGELYQGDLDVGRRAVDRLAGEALGAHVAVEDLSYGAVAVAQRLEELRPDALVLVGAASRGRPPGTVERRRVAGLAPAPADVRQAVAEAVTGYVSIDLALEVAGGLGALPERTVVIEVEPVSCEPCVELSPEAASSLERVLALVRAEVGRVLPKSEEGAT